MLRLVSGKTGTRWSLLLAALVFILLGCGRSPAAGEQDNFRGIKWGAEFSSLSGFNQIAHDGDLTFFEKQGETLQMESIKLDQIIYGFHKGRFYTAMVYFPASAFPRMKEILTGQMGEPTQPDKTPSKLAWDGPNVTVLLTTGGNADLARLAYVYKPVQLESELKK